MGLSGRGAAGQAPRVRAAHRRRQPRVGCGLRGEAAEARGASESRVSQTGCGGRALVHRASPWPSNSASASSKTLSSSALRGATTASAPARRTGSKESATTRAEAAAGEAAREPDDTAASATVHRTSRFPWRAAAFARRKRHETNATPRKLRRPAGRSVKRVRVRRAAARPTLLALAHVPTGCGALAKRPI